MEMLYGCMFALHVFLNSINTKMKLFQDHSTHFVPLNDLPTDNQKTSHTSLLRKSADRDTILHACSFHPKWLNEIVPHGQLLRVSRICYQECLRSLKPNWAFKNGGYKDTILQKAQTTAKTPEGTNFTTKNMFPNKQDAAQRKNILNRL